MKRTLPIILALALVFLLSLGGRGKAAIAATDDAACCQSCFNWGWWLAGEEERRCNEMNDWANPMECYWEGVLTGQEYFINCNGGCFRPYLCGFFLE